MSDDQPRRISRRDLLRSAGLASAAAIIPGGLSGKGVEKATLPIYGDPVIPAQTVAGSPAMARQTLSVAEFEVLTAMVARIIPADELGPGAREAGAQYYIDRELGGALSDQKEAYQIGLAALDRYSRYARGRPFIELSEPEKDSVLIDCQGGSATATGAGFAGSSGQFFNMVRSHTLQGTFADPYYGGNRDFIGWDLLRYPGVRTGVSAADQARMEAQELPPNHRSAYEG
jgi:gluconate 2-dehydrogenase gamma chain